MSISCCYASLTLFHDGYALCGSIRWNCERAHSFYLRMTIFDCRIRCHDVSTNNQPFHLSCVPLSKMSHENETNTQRLHEHIDLLDKSVLLRKKPLGQLLSSFRHLLHGQIGTDHHVEWRAHNNGCSGYDVDGFPTLCGMDHVVARRFVVLRHLPMAQQHDSHVILRHGTVNDLVLHNHSSYPSLPQPYRW